MNKKKTKTKDFPSITLEPQEWGQGVPSIEGRHFLLWLPGAYIPVLGCVYEVGSYCQETDHLSPAGDAEIKSISDDVDWEAIEKTAIWAYVPVPPSWRGFW